jgi:hypothetical protein
MPQTAAYKLAVQSAVQQRKPTHVRVRYDQGEVCCTILRHINDSPQLALETVLVQCLLHLAQHQLLVRQLVVPDVLSTLIQMSKSLAHRQE